MSTTKKSNSRQDPKGGLTAAGRRHFAKTEGAHLKPGVKKAESEMSVEEMKRKGSFLRRHYGREKPFKLTDAKGEPTRYALQAHAWGERVPKNADDIARLAAKGAKLLEKAEKKSGASSSKKSTAKPAKTAKGAASKTAPTKPKKSSGAKTAKASRSKK